MTRKAWLFGLVVSTIACGGSAPPASQPGSAGNGASGDGVVRPITQGQLKCAHYSTGDGVIGLVLDRTGDRAKVKVDNDKDIVELTMEEDRHFGERRGWYLKRPDGRNMMYLTVNGGLTFFKGSDELHLNSDSAAPPLGAPTVAGQYVAPTPDWKIAGDKLRPVAVRTKLPQLKPEDSANLARVADALAAATPEMFVHYASHGSTNASPYPRIVPQSFEGLDFGGVGRTSDEPWKESGAGLAKYGGRNEGFSHYDTPLGNHMQVMTLSGYKPALAEGAPGLVWEVGDSTTAVFVTLDGDRWEVGTTTLDPGVGPVASWPSPAKDALLDVHAVASLVKAGALPQPVLDDLLAADQEWTKCAANVWAPVVKMVDQQTSAAPHAILIVPNAFTDDVRKQYEQKARTTCAAIIRKQEASLVKIVDGRLKDRLALYEKAKARASALGLGR